MATKSQRVATLARLFRLLGDPTRLRILEQLQGGERNVSTLVKKLRLAQPTVSHHLALLRTGDIVIARRAGKEVYYSLNGDQPVSEKAIRQLFKNNPGLKVGKLIVALGK